MKKSRKMIIAGVIVAAIGVVVLLCAVGMSGCNFEDVNNWQESAYNATATVERLNIKVNWGQVVVNRGETDKISVKYEFNDRYAPKFEENNGKLNIETSQKRWYEFGIWIERAPRMEITVPQNVALSELHLTLNAGTVEFGGGRWCEAMSVKINAGTVTMGEVLVGEFDAKLNAGAIQIQKIDCTKFNCKLNAGAFDVNEVICQEFDCEMNAGGVNVKKLDSSSSIKLKLSAGGATLGLAGAQSDYNVSVSKSAGSCNVSAQTSATATRTLSVSLSAGSVNVSFGK